MKNAIARVFPGTRHRLCLWHILKKLPEKFGAHSQFDGIKSTLRKCVYDSQTHGEFEESWKTLLVTYNLEDNDWLRGLYNERASWIPAYLKGVFWAGMTTTQRSESMNAFFDGYVHPTTTLKQFVDQYDGALRKKVENERIADFNSFNTTIQCVAVTDAYMKHVKFCVCYNGDECELKCSCGRFETRGILCRHVFSVLSACNITSLPQKYFLDRWRNDLKRRYTFIQSSYDSLGANPIAQKYDDLCKDMHKLAALAVTNVDNYMEATKYVHMLMDKFSGSSYEPSPPSQALVGASSTCNKSMDGVENNKVRSPLAVRGKGKPSSKRKMSPVEEVVVKK
ncbi:protein FAR-RED ELONGATED HYPOCOTYL 3-like [Corylus avellana]|uniref:protein FAR-RED ELONGATED HYPOCOTYL 3-like n=1 Tax=Corylus avellana TaxID=13451 RepID=UPI00286D386E|nr:protein FAR-RED ELONGATED HYPOCOTYL 3-like [Corylus avellana]